MESSHVSTRQSTPNEPSPNADLAAVRAYLDDFAERFARPDSVGAIRALVLELNQRLEDTRRRLSEEVWFESVAPFCRTHKLAAVLGEDPYTSRALEKPRGFAGDAALLDYVYDGVVPPQTTKRGAEIMQGTAGSPSGASVRDRRDRLASAIRHAIDATERPKILSIACGHLRELQLLNAEETSRLGEFIGLDQDTLALDVAAESAAPGVVIPVHAGIRDVIAGRVDASQCNLVYAAGLFDYLSDFAAERLLKKMASLLAPGGRLIVGNFAPGNFGRAYMESIMDWRLEHRSIADMKNLVQSARPTQGFAVERVYEDSLGNIAYLDVTLGS